MADRTAVLETLQNELLERLERYRAHKRRQGGALDKDMEEQAVEIQNDDVVDSLEKEAVEELRQVQHALDRIAMGEGGRCEICEEPIAPARLATLPDTTRCRECAES